MVEMKKPKLYTIEVNGCELIDILCSYDLEKELTDLENDFVRSKLIKTFYDEYKEVLDLNYWKLKAVNN